MTLPVKDKRISPFIRTTMESAMHMSNPHFTDPSTCKVVDSDNSISETMSGIDLTKSEDESPLMTFILPLFKVLRLLFFTHSRFEFDNVKGEYRHCPGSLLRKAICLVVQILTTAFIYLEVRYLSFAVGGSSIAFMYKLMGVSYIIYNICFFRSIMTKGDDIVEIFNFVQSTTIVVRKAGCRIPRKKIVRWITMGFITFYMSHSVLYVLVNINGEDGVSIGNGISFLHKVADFNAIRFQVAFSSKNISEVAIHSFVRENPNSLALLVSFLSLWLGLMSAFSWTFAFLLITLWGFLFWKVLYNFFACIGKSSVRNTLEDIRRFNAITGLVDRFNHAFSWVILSGVLCGIAHFSVNIVEVFKDDKDVWSKIVVAISFLLFGLKLLAAAQVNKTAADIVETIKLRYQMEPIWREFHGNCIETTQGMVLILHETLSNSIGFQGLGFFTITYSFIGTVLSVISTYSVVVMQFQTKTASTN